ncbi:MAG: oligoendopeptidase F, partial [Chlamydiota bacterium]
MAQEGKIRERKEVEAKDCWNVEAMYEGWAEWDKDFKALPQVKEGLKWPVLSEKEVNISNPMDMKVFLDALMKVDLQLSTLYTYAHLRHDEDVVEEKAKQAYMMAMGMLYSFKEEVSWVEPALLQLPEEVLQGFLSSDILLDYRIYLKKIIRLKPHTLSSKEEKLMALAEKALETSHRAFSSLNNADIKFPPCKDEKGQTHELTLGTYQLYMKSYDRTLRKESFLHLHQTFASYENTLCELIQGEMQQHVFRKKARGYPSCLASALYPNQVDVSVYASLLTGVRKHISSLHDYINLRKKLLGYEDLHVYDLGVPIIEGMDLSFSYEEAVDLICRSVSVLGVEYQEILRKGLTEQKWVDIYENAKKRSGAYSSGCYGSMPYILMNYHGTFRDVMTLAHEAGHSMHSYFSTKHQKYQDYQYPIFLAEVASTFHEELLFQHFLEKADSLEKKAYLINQKIDDIRNTLFRQTLFAEFELALHEWVEQDQPLTPALLKEHYYKLSREYFGEGIKMDEEIAYEWSRIPHFYYNFYVYQYATGVSAAHVLAKRVLGNEPLAKEQYLAFISSGGSEDPITTLKKAGVDMNTSYPVDTM